MESNLSSTVKAVIAKRSISAAERFELMFVAKYPDQPNKTIEQQLNEVNTFWRIQLGKLPIDTKKERECLINQIQINDWLRNFDDCVADTIVNNNLPME